MDKGAQFHDDGANPMIVGEALVQNLDLRFLFENEGLKGERIWCFEG